MVSQEPSVHEYVRIEIFTQEGTKEGNVELPFDRQYVNIVDIHARTIQPDGSIVNFDGKKPFPHAHRELVNPSAFFVTNLPADANLSEKTSFLQVGFP